MSRLSETVSREQFILWRDGLDEYLDQYPDWSQSTKTLETVRSWAQEATPQRVQDISGMHIELLKVKSAELFGPRIASARMWRKGTALNSTG